jgi:hypothetical protein
MKQTFKTLKSYAAIKVGIVILVVLSLLIPFNLLRLEKSQALPYFRNKSSFLINKTQELNSGNLSSNLTNLSTTSILQKQALNSSQLKYLFENLKPSAGDFKNSIRYGIGEFFDTKKPPNNIHNFNVTLNPFPRHVPECSANSNSNLLILALVIISPDFVDKRQVIRETWASKNASNPTDLRVLFVVGLSKANLTNKRVREEFVKYGDIIQEDYFDSYFNITIKVLGAFKWVRDHCPKVKYVLRVNDHMEVNVFSLISYLKGANYSHTIWGMLLSHSPPIWSPENKWYVPKDEYDFHTYLPYMEGSAFLVDGELAKSIYVLSTHVYWPRLSTAMEV